MKTKDTTKIERIKLSSMLGAFLVLLATVSLVLNVEQVSAAWPNSTSTYFNKKWDHPCGLAKCPVLPAKQQRGRGDNGYATFAFNSGYYTNSSRGSATKARAMVNTLKQYYNGSHSNIKSGWGYNDSYAKTGAAFVVKTMLGYSDGTSKTVSSAQWAQLENRLVAKAEAGQINWNVNKSRKGDWNTAMAKNYNSSGSWPYDVRAYKEDNIESRVGMRIQNNNGSYYELLYACGNPSGTMNAIDDESWELDPSVATNPSDGVEVGSDLDVQPSVRTSGSGRPTTNWQILEVVVNPGVTIPGASNTSTSPCDYYDGSGRTCGVASFDSGSGTGNTRFSVPVHDFTTRSTTVPDLPPGSRLCYGLSVRDRAHNSSQWRHSELACVYIGKKPKVQVHGGDLLVGRALSDGSIAGNSSIYTSTTEKTVSNNQRMFGSWVEYGAFATGSINGLGSGSAFAGSSGLAFGGNSDQCDYSSLTFSNATFSSSSQVQYSCSSSTAFGQYETNSSVPDIASIFSSNDLEDLGSRSTIDLSASYSNESKVYTTGRNNINLQGGSSDIQPGRWFVLYAPNSTVTINGGINYTSNILNSTEDIPQVVIIAENINIRENVSNVDAWLVAVGTGDDGSINTCSNYSATSSLTINQCSAQLTVNGPVTANHLHLRRTAGSGSGNQSGDPAEIFNIRPDAYIWAMNRARASGQPSSVFTLELPPRF